MQQRITFILNTSMLYGLQPVSTNPKHNHHERFTERSRAIFSNSIKSKT